MSKNVFESDILSTIKSINTTAKIEHFQTLLPIDDFDEEVINYIRYKLKEIFSILGKTEPTLVNCVVNYLESDYIRTNEILRMDRNAIFKLIALLQSVSVSKVFDDSPNGYGVKLNFDDDLGEDKGVDDFSVDDFILMMRAILVELRGKKFIKFFTIHRNGIQIFPTLTTPPNPPPPHFRGTSTSTSTSISIPATIQMEVKRIVDIIFEVSEVSKVSKVSEVSALAIQYITNSFSHAKISDAILEFFKKVKKPDIILMPGTNTITLKLHDNITLIEKVTDHPEYCNELTQFINLMGVLCSICTTEMREINPKMSVKYTIPQGIMNSLHRSVKSCKLSLDAAPDDATGGDGRTPRRKHARKTNRKHNRKTRHKRARKTRHKRTHRSRIARKHKKYSRKR